VKVATRFCYSNQDAATPCSPVPRHVLHFVSKNNCRGSEIKMQWGILRRTGNRFLDYEHYFQISFISHPQREDWIIFFTEFMPVLVIMQRKACMVLGLRNTGIIGSNPATDITFAFLCLVLSCVSTGLATDRSPVQGILPKCLKGFSFRS